MATIVRECPGCGQERTRAEMRDVDGPRTGRPPKFCRECRATDPAKQKFYTDSIEAGSREDCLARQRRYAARSADEIAADQFDSHPDGVKTCPEVSGCGRTLPLSAFADSAWQHDGLHSVCRECVRD